MPLGSLFALQFFGPGCSSATGTATNTSPLAGLVGEGRIGAVNTIAPTAYARISDGRRLAAVNTAVNSSPLAAIRGDGRIAAVGKVNELTQDDVTGAVLEAEVEAGLSLKKALRLLLSVAAGKTDISGSTVTFRDVNDTTDRVVAGMTGSERTTMTLDPD
jgi:hypothetical protein